jgi:phosphoglycolate phosphatase
MRDSAGRSACTRRRDAQRSMMSKLRRDAVLFDLDGVLVDSRSAITGCINYALVAHGLPEQAEGTLYGFIGPPLALAFAELTKQPSDSAVVVSCVRTYRERYAEASLRETAVVPGITDALSQLADTHRLAVATSKPVVFAEPLLVALGLRNFFDVVAAPKLSAPSEHKSTTIGLALSALSPIRAVMVGDRSFDIIGAHQHGLPAIGVTWGIGGTDELASEGAEAIVRDPKELPAAARRLVAGASHGLPRL